MKTNDVISQQMKEFEDKECAGIHCEHETSKKHYIVFESDLRSSFLALLESIGEEVIGQDERTNMGVRRTRNKFREKQRSRLSDIIKTGEI